MESVCGMLQGWEDLGASNGGVIPGAKEKHDCPKAQRIIEAGAVYSQTMRNSPNLQAFPRLDIIGCSACKNDRGVEWVPHSTRSGMLGTESIQTLIHEQSRRLKCHLRHDWVWCPPHIAFWYIVSSFTNPLSPNRYYQLRQARLPNP